MSDLSPECAQKRTFVSGHYEQPRERRQLKPTLPPVALKFAVPTVFQVNSYVTRWAGLMSYDAAQQLGRFRSEADIDLGGSRDRIYGCTPSSRSGRLSLGTQRPSQR